MSTCRYSRCSPASDSLRCREGGRGPTRAELGGRFGWLRSTSMAHCMISVACACACCAKFCKLQFNVAAYVSSRILGAFRRLREELGDSLQETSSRSWRADGEARRLQQADQVAIHRRGVVGATAAAPPAAVPLTRRFPSCSNACATWQTDRHLFRLPARDRVAALQLDADVMVSAGDPDVRVLKPHSRACMS